MSIRFMKTINSSAVLLACIALASCSAGNGENLDENGQPIVIAEVTETAVDETPTDQAQDQTPVVVASAFGEIQSTIFTPICMECHGVIGGSAGLSLAAPGSFANIVGVSSTQVSSLSRISPNDPDNSYLVQKIEGIAAVGGQMPLGGPPLPQESIDLVRQWVTDGALPDTEEALAFAPRVASVSISNNAVVDQIPNVMSIVWTSPIDNNSLNTSTISLQRSGGDGSFTDGNEVAVDVVIAETNNPFVTKVIPTELKSVDDDFQLRIIGDGDIYARAADARAIDGNNDGVAGGNYSHYFTIENP